MQAIRQFALRKKKLLIRLTAIALAVVGSVSMLSRSAFAQNTYVITDGDQVTYHTSYATDPAKVLDEAGFKLGIDDTYTTQESDGVSEISLRRFQTVTVNDGGDVVSVVTKGESVEELLTQLGITVDAQTRVSQPLDAETIDGMQIVVSRTTYVTETYTQSVPYQVRELNDASLSVGERQVLTRGCDGEMVCTAQVTYVDGVETNRTVLSSQVTTAPVDELVAVGTGAAEATAGELVIGDGVITLPTGEVLAYSDTMDVQATAYSQYDAGCTTTTATGTTVHWGTVAVDPDMIPYGTRMFIATTDGSYIYGIATAEDCGGAIQGNRIDLYMPSKSECFAFGRRSCTVYFLA